MAAVWFITGVSSGFGTEIALRALEGGQRVIGTVRDRIRAADNVAIIEHKGGMILELDVTDAVAGVKVFGEAERVYGRIDVLVNNAGYSILGAIEDISDEEARLQMETNFFGPRRLIREALPGFRARKSGTIVNISSRGGIDGVPGGGLYAASKFALEGLSESLAREVAPFNVNVLIIEPGGFRTNIFSAYKFPQKPHTEGYQTVRAFLDMVATISSDQLSQMGDPKKAASRIYEAVTGEGLAGKAKGTVLRMPLGEDCVTAYEAKIQIVRTGGIIDIFTDVEDNGCPSSESVYIMGFVKPELSVWERATLIFAVLRTLGSGAYTSFIAPFRGSSGSAKYSDHVKIAMMRTILENTTVRQQQATIPHFNEVYSAFVKEKGVTPSHVELPSGTKAYWIGNKDADKVILWFHGGGYNLPVEPGHFTFNKELADLSGGKIAILMLSYTLAPHEIYPHQLRQAVELVQYVFTELKRKPENVTIAGDSAGANLSIAILSHMLHPHPQIPPLNLEQGQKLGAAILLCPWASFSTDAREWPSMGYNASSDYISAPSGNKWSSSFLGGQISDPYSEPLSADKSWWKGLDGIVEEILILGGGGEVLLDVIRELARRYEAVHPKVKTVIAEGEWHNKPIMTAMGLPRGGGQSDAVKSFVKARL
ncbi:hypothetical protein ACLMJK_006430 [Lecanora helva]